MSTTLLLDSSQTTGNSTNFYVYYNPPIQLDPTKQYEIGLISCTCWNAMANIKTDVNDELVFTAALLRPISPEIDLKIPRLVPVKIKIPQGAYNIEDLNREIKRLITKAGHNADSFELTANYNTLRARITLRGSHTGVAFGLENSIGPLLGFRYSNFYHITPNQISQTFDGELSVNITDVNTILVNCSIASGSYTAKDKRYTVSRQKLRRVLSCKLIRNRLSIIRLMSKIKYQV